MVAESLTYDQVVEREKEKTRRWVDLVSQQAINSRRDLTPPDPPPLQPPGRDASVRELLSWWRLKTAGDFFGGFLFTAISKLIDQNDALAARVEQLEQRDAALKVPPLPVP